MLPPAGRTLCHQQVHADPGAAVGSVQDSSTLEQWSSPFLPQRRLRRCRRIGGRTGWYYGNWLWTVRGFIDLLLGGVGVRRGRRDEETLRVGDAPDFWRVELSGPGSRLRLHAEMKVPGRAWLEFEVTPCEEGSAIRQTAIFDPQGLFRILYWYGIYPLHQCVFAGMLRNIACAAEVPVVSDGSDGSVEPTVMSSVEVRRIEGRT